MPSPNGRRVRSTADNYEIKVLSCHLSTYGPGGVNKVDKLCMLVRFG